MFKCIAINQSNKKLPAEIGFNGELRFFFIFNTFNSSPKSFEAQEQSDLEGYRDPQFSVSTPHYTDRHILYI